MQRELELATLDGDRVEHLVHDPGDLLGARLDDRRQVALLPRLRAGGKEAGRADHRVELIPQLVADVGQQLRIDLDQAMRMPVGVLLGGLRSNLAKLSHQYSCSVGG